MLSLLVALASAADLESTLDGKPYVIATALGKPDPERPWVWGVMLSDGAFTCDDFASGKVNRSVSQKTSNKNGKTTTKTEVKGPKDDTRILAMFADATVGTTAAFVMGSGEGGKDMPLEKNVVRVAKAPADGPGTLEVDLASKGFRLAGEVPFTMCGTLGTRPAIAWSGAPKPVTIETASFFPDQEAPKLAITMAVPDGWTFQAADKDAYRFDPRWMAQDGITALAISLESPPEQFADDAKERGESTFEAWASGLTDKRSEALSDGAWVLAYGTATQRSAEVFRYEKGWSHQIHCTLSSDPVGAAAVFEQAIAACAAITVP